MAAQEFLRSSKIRIENTGFAVAGGKEDFSGRYEQNLVGQLARKLDVCIVPGVAYMVMNRSTLRRQGALEEGGQEGV
jgi:hypothetical protein